MEKSELKEITDLTLRAEDFSLTVDEQTRLEFLKYKQDREKK